MTVSDASGATLAWIFTPSESGRKNVAPGRVDTCWTWKMGAPRSRKARKSRDASTAAASLPTSSILPPGK